MKHVSQYSGISEADETEVSSCESEYFVGKPDEKCQDKTISDNFKLVVLNEYKELFQGIGKLEGEINISLKPNAIPYVAPVCRIAHSPQEPLKKELDRLVQEGIIVPLSIDDPSGWCNSFVCICKPNWKIRLCLDSTQLNKFMVNPHHGAKLVEDLLPKLSGAKVFSIVDACSSFLWWQKIKLSNHICHTLWQV